MRDGARPDAGAWLDQISTVPSGRCSTPAFGPFMGSGLNGGGATSARSSVSVIVSSRAAFFAAKVTRIAAAINASRRSRQFCCGA
jgi:hypothetical protein